MAAGSAFFVDPISSTERIQNIEHDRGLSAGDRLTVGFGHFTWRYVPHPSYELEFLIYNIYVCVCVFFLIFFLLFSFSFFFGFFGFFGRGESSSVFWCFVAGPVVKIKAQAAARVGRPGILKGCFTAPDESVDRIPQLQ